ncbi:MAG: acetyl-CoA carboxylase carboxyltransferase subunit alpha [Sphaerochaetaceae bacterium]|nr:acetyl-CoA carboxylase carboxyltransferase subunit alpha [Sphaerochaetaceae bacterium]MDC7236343.1 acetyl-CoA carboxylase carboxyltransferase subunit alpha [Sphaerochaetaceae bacterium]MDC7249185.1 acetyl-CoA carboxylase carboxyltransferase subunit alpha [Sphaerochaetaceae bacterium]
MSKIELKEMSERLSRVDKYTKKRTPWECVKLSRNINRPGVEDYIKLICDDFMPLCGDRLYGEDKAMLGGIGLIDGRAVTIIGNRKGSNLKENIDVNYGMSHPEGYRKALRLAKQAERFNRPIISFIDTPGAYPGLGSEERGIGEAIATNLKEFSTLSVPIISFIIGEGGSGGALGIGVSDKLYLLENAVYSVITPEGFASILMHDPSKAEEAANIMKMTAQDLLEMEIIHGIIKEDKDGAHVNPEFSASEIKKTINKDLNILTKKKPDSLVRYRLKKIRSIGASKEQESYSEPLLKVLQKIY